MAHGELFHERLTHSVIGAFYEAYNGLGFGFLEHVYVAALECELVARGHLVRREVPIPVFYKGAEIARQRLDILVDDLLVIETKATFQLHESALRQLYNYLHATRLGVGLVLHFGPKPRVHRIVCRRWLKPGMRGTDPFDPSHPDASQ